MFRLKAQQFIIAFVSVLLTTGLSVAHAAYHYSQPYQGNSVSEAPKTTLPSMSHSLAVASKQSLQPVLETANPSPILMAAIQDSRGESTEGLTATDITVIRGRSRILKFAQPIARVSIADPQLADIIPLAPDEIMLNGRQRGVTSLIVWDNVGREGVFDLNITNDTSELQRAIEGIAPNENIRINVTDDSVVVSGTASNTVILDEIRQLAGAYGYRDTSFVDLTETPIPQVVLEVKIVEMSRQLARDLKTSFSSDAGNTFSITRLANTLETVTGSSPTGSAVSGLSQAASVTTASNGLIPARPIAYTQSGNNLGGITGSLFGFGGSNFGIAFDFLETEGKLRTLAEPKLVSTHGRAASFLAGGEFPFVAGVDAQGGPILSFREYGVGLNFTPWVNVRSGLIELQIAPEVSSIDTSNCVATNAGQVCGLIRRSTDTTVQLNDGETLMISGILSKSEEDTFAKVPFIGDIPIIGELFKNRTTNKRDTELIVVVTPRILERTHTASLQPKNTFPKP